MVGESDPGHNRIDAVALLSYDLHAV